MVVCLFIDCKNKPTEPDFTPDGVTTLILDVEAPGVINTVDGEQWFTFTATTSTQYIIIKYNTLTKLFFQLYDNKGKAVGERTYCSYTPPYHGTYIECTVTPERVYFIRITPYSSTGTFTIFFSNSLLTPEDKENATLLSENEWTAGVSTIDDDQLFKFTPNSVSQRIHINFGTLTNLMVRVYDQDGIIHGGDDSDRHLSGNSHTTRNISQAFITGQAYYISVWAFHSTGSGTYWIAFNNSQVSPTSHVFPSMIDGATTLTSGVWINGTIPTESWGQWYIFTATASMQYVHADFITIPRFDIRLCDITNDSIGNYITLSGNYSYAPFTVTEGNEYCIEVTPTDNNESGMYRIAFNTSATAPESVRGNGYFSSSLGDDGNCPAFLLGIHNE